MLKSTQQTPYLVAFSSVFTGNHFLKNYEIYNVDSLYGKKSAKLWDKVSDVITGYQKPMSINYGPDADNQINAINLVFSNLAIPLFLTLIQTVTEEKGYAPSGVLLARHGRRGFDSEVDFDILKQLGCATELPVYRIKEYGNQEYVDLYEDNHMGLVSLSKKCRHLETLSDINPEVCVFAQCLSQEDKPRRYLTHALSDTKAISHVGYERYNSFITRLIKLISVFPSQLFKVEPSDSDATESFNFKCFGYQDNRWQYSNKTAFVKTHLFYNQKDSQLTLTLDFHPEVAPILAPVVISTLQHSFPFVVISDNKVKFIIGNDLS